MCAAVESGRLKARAKRCSVAAQGIPRHILWPQETQSGERSISTYDGGIIGPGASVMDAQLGRNSRWYFVIGLTVLAMVYSAAVLTVKFLFL